MVSDTDAISPNDDDQSSHKVGTIAERTIKNLEDKFEELRLQPQQLLSDRIDLENRVGKQKSIIGRLSEEVRLMRMPPHVIGNIQDILDK